MKYYTIINGKWQIAHRYNLATMRQIALYDFIGGEMVKIGIGLY
jgi:hypothetical protein